MARQYFADAMTYAKPEPRHRLCWQHEMVTLQQRGRDNFAVRYGKQVDADLTYGQACAKLGQALMHQLACSDGEDGKPLVDNRKRGER